MGEKSPIISVFEWNGRLAQLVRAPSSHGGGHWFESSIAHQHLPPSEGALSLYCCQKIRLHPLTIHGVHAPGGL